MAESRHQGDSGNTVWDRIYAAGGYEHEPDPELLRLCESIPVGAAFDVGAGEGRHALWLASRGWRVTAIDVSTEGIARLKQRAETMGLKIDTAVASATDYPFPAGKHDLVLSTGCVLNFFRKADAKRVIDRMKGAVTPGGRIYLTVSTVKDPAYQRLRSEASEVIDDSFFVQKGEHWVTAYERGELASCFADWELRDCREREVHDTHGMPHTHHMAFLSARRPGRQEEYP